MLSPDCPNRLDVPAGLDLDAGPDRAGANRGVDLLPQPAEVPVGRDPDHGADGQGLEPRPSPEVLGQRAVLRAQLGVGDGHFERGGEQAIGRSAAEQLRHLGGGREVPVPCRGRAEEPAHPAVTSGLFNLVERRIDRGALRQRSTLPPPLAASGHDPDEQEGAPAVDAGGGSDFVAEGDVDPHQFDAIELHPFDRPLSHVVRVHAATVDRALYARAFQPGWRNGRRGGLKSRCPKGRAGSSPAPGTSFSLVKRRQPLQKRPEVTKGALPTPSGSARRAARWTTTRDEAHASSWARRSEVSARCNLSERTATRCSRLLTTRGKDGSAACTSMSRAGLDHRPRRRQRRRRGRGGRGLAPALPGAGDHRSRCLALDARPREAPRSGGTVVRSTRRGPVIEAAHRHAAAQ